MIYVESNENRSEVPRILDKLGLAYEYTHLQVCDYFVGIRESDGTFDGVGIERKEAGDYVSSLLSGHLANQLYSMSFGLNMSYLIIIGDIQTEARDRQVPWNTMLSSLVGSSFKRSPDGAQGVVVPVQVGSDWDFAECLRFLDKKWTKGEQRVPAMVKKAWRLDDYALYVVSSIPNVGRVTSEKLLSHFSTIKALANATPEQLQEVDGIGKRKSEDIYRLLNSSFVKESA